ncbi:MAG: DUF308 domain-containing protein [Flavobacteriaceae bacterium]
MESGSNIKNRLLKATKSFTLIGVLALILGIIAVVYPQAFGEITTQILGIVLMLGGLARAIFAGAAFSFSSMFLRWIYAVVMIVAGVWIFMNPDMGLEALTIVLGVYFIVDGITSIVYSFSLMPIGGGTWVLINGILGIVLGILIFSKWPQSSEFVVGIYLGIKLIMDGISLVITGYVLRKSLDAISLSDN